MASTATPSPEGISDSKFHDYLERYQACVTAISEAKGAKPGQKTLAALDQYRYGPALDSFGSGNPDAAMGLDNVKELVEWKLRHGKFRPTLMKLVSSNEPGFVKDTIQKAIKHYRDKSDISGALNVLTQLKGIGPATASLLLAVHDPGHVLFFADEAFYWLCCDGTKAPIKYNQKEYMALNARAQALAKRLGVKAVDIERVAFVLMRQPRDEKTAANTVAKTASASASKPRTESPAETTGRKPPAKRKASGDARPLPILSSMVDSKSRARRVETQPFCPGGPIQLTPRFTALKESLTAGKEAAITSSWQRLLQRLPEEIDVVSSLGSQAIPTISFADTAKPQQAKGFLRDLRQRGVGIIRNVVSRDTALAWSKETEGYLEQNSQTGSTPTTHAQTQDVYWSPAQVKARAHPSVLEAQKFVMSIWHSKDPNARVTTDFPVAYADRMRVPKKGGGSSSKGPPYAHVDGGSVERWEPDGYGRAGTYKDIFQGRWEDYDPWESSTRLGVTSDLYHKASACSIFRMYQGWLALHPIPSGRGPGSSSSSVQVCPLPRLSTAYFLLRPFVSFSPPAPAPEPAPLDAAQTTKKEWTLNRPQNSLLHGALPSYAQEIHPALHPHLDLDRSLVSVPDLEPGDYLVWHPDLIHAISSNAPAEAERKAEKYMYLPACPLTQTNALYLARQRKAFLRGQPGPDFFDGARGGESEHTGRPGVQEVNDAGGDDGLRAMGLLPWDEEEADEDGTRAVLAMANGILFPDLYDML
ncbi:hypothetical protein C8A00DRAFT_19161 [Chaetomidium leptoderma]|uniref:DUF1479-domain-containing protein n=1 Tax=Chaetomidium leptoderma TaxID=669021 RepID=A0AAN6VCZ1_9PEZI|nr:hypothetical protein C8A00DRAFT_19161 [Chaetomidium leptoderma]